MRFMLWMGLFVLGTQAVAQNVKSDQVVSGVIQDEPANLGKKSFEFNLDWKELDEIGTLDERSIEYLTFTGARWKNDHYLPYFAKSYFLPAGATDARIKLSDFEAVEVTAQEKSFLQDKDLPNDFSLNYFVKKAGDNYVAVVTLEPIRRNGGSYQKLSGFNIEVQPKYASTRGSRSTHSWKASSVLSSGDWYKIAIVEEGIYKVSYADLQSYGLPVAGVTSDQVRLYGTRAGQLSMMNSDVRPDDLEQLSIKVEDGGDGSFDPGDYFLFYGEDQTTWEFSEDRFEHTLNAFADSTFYFVTLSATGTPNRIQSVSVNGSATYSTSTYDYYAAFEEDVSNLIQSGRTWYGAQLNASKTSIDYGFEIPNIDKTSSIKLRSRLAARSVSFSGVSVGMSLPNQGGVATTADVPLVQDFYGALYGYERTMQLETLPASSSILVKLELNNTANPSAQAWVDFVEINARRVLSMPSDYFSFRDLNGVAQGQIAEYRISASVGIEVWDVTDLTSIVQPSLTGGVVNGFRFKQDASKLREFVAFSEEAPKKPFKSGRVENQNLHALSSIEYIIVAHPLFKNHAQRLADLHSGLDGLSSLVVTPQQIYNEFSGGAQDVTAIKEFMRKLYFEADSLGGLKPRYLLLFGDASYDYKDRISGNSNFVPTHQMRNSLSPTGSIASDDYYGILDDDEGESVDDFIDIGVGRLPARSKKEAEDMVNKITRYANTSNSFGEWRNKVTFVADDADPRDSKIFMTDFETLGAIVDSDAPEYIIQKLYMDSFKQQNGAGGERYPEGAQAITNAVTRGTLMMYFIGHGGELGWAHERILEVSTINRWVNLDRLPLLVTATCEFARFDDPRRTSAGEFCLLNPSGGAIALLTTTRAVFASPNLTLTTAFTEEAFKEVNGSMPTLGDLMLITKIKSIDTPGSGAASNSRSFALLGDPALRLAYPKMDVEVTSMPDTVKALEKVKIEGFVADLDGNKLTDFNGIVYPAVFDKETKQQTLNNDGDGPFTYYEWSNLVFKGKSSVKNGDFTVEFVVPKDIGKNIAIGRVNLYATNGKIDALGDYREFNIGGVSDNPIVDEQGPEVDLFMNDDNFVFGGMTNENPDLYAEIMDDYGINMVGSGVGHDITAVLDANTSNTLILNDFYEANIDSYQSGTIRYPFNQLEEGKHTLKLQVWDVNNNPSEAYTEFIVANDEQFALDHILNYPNPFTTNTDFYFEHNKPGLELDVSIDVFTVAGKLVKTIEGEFFSEGFRVGPINWNGRDQYGDQLAKGVYLYRVSVRTPIGETVEEYERLVMLK